MRRLAVAVAALVLLRADMYQDASNAKLPEARINLGIGLNSADFGFVGDGATVAITTTASSTTFSPPLPDSAIGKAITVPGAGAGGNPLVTTVAGAMSFAAPAATASSPSTYYADKGRACPVAISQSGAGNYQPNDTITLGTAACKVSYTQIVGTPTIVNGGTGCTTGSGMILTGTTGAGDHADLGFFRVFATASAGSVTAVTGIWWPGRYRTNPTNLASEPVTGAGCTGARLAIPQMGVGLAYVSQPGGVASKPADPVAQTATSGTGTGAAFTMTDVWRQAGEATWGTDNTPAMQRLAADTTSPKVNFPAGTYLYNCGNYDMASAVSLLGDGIGKSVLKLFPYCNHSGTLLRWGDGKNGVTIDGMTFDNSRAYNTTAPALRYAIAAGGDNFRFSNNSIINMRPLSIGLIMSGAGGTAPLLNPVIRDNYIHFLNPDPTAAEAIHISNNFGAPAGVTGAVISGNYADGAGIDFCLDGGVVSNNEVVRAGYGTGFYMIPDPLCRNTLIVNNVAHDSIDNTDTNLTIPSGFEIDGYRAQVAGNLAYRNAGNGFRILTQNGVISGNTAWSNTKYQPPANLPFISQASGFAAIGPNANGSVFLGNSAYDDGLGVQQYGYSESGSFMTVTLAGNNFRGPSGPIGARAAGSIAPASTVASLPACNASSKYLTQPVSDQSGVPAYRGALTGGGAIAVLAYCNGTSWEAH